MKIKEDNIDTNQVDKVEQVEVQQPEPKPKAKRTRNTKTKKENTNLKTETKVNKDVTNIFEAYPNCDEIWVDKFGGAWTFEVANSTHYKR